MLSLFQTVGALLGFVATALLLWDRFIRHRPFVRLSAGSDRRLPGTQRELFAEVINPGPYPIVVRASYSKLGLRPHIDDSMRSAIVAALGRDFSFPINAEGKEVLPLGLPANFDGFDPGALIDLSFRWWPAQTRWAQHPGWPLRLQITKDRLDTILEPRRHERDDP